MKIKFVDIDPNVIDALSKSFSDLISPSNRESRISATCGDIRLESGDALVSPANSYGWMNGGIDAVYLQIYGYQLQVRVQSKIAENYDGYLPVGDAMSVCAMGFGPQWPKYLIVAPTMETPQNVGDTQNAFKAFSAALAEARKLKLSTLICPGMCSLTGGMNPEEMARQMREAFDFHSSITENPHLDHMNILSGEKHAD